MGKNNKKIFIIGIIILIVIIFILLFGKKNNRFVLDAIYDVNPDEIKELYSNMVNVSCKRDLSFDIEIDTGEKDISEISSTNLLDYMFSYMDKHNLLNDKITTSTINKIEDELFDEKLKLVKSIKNYQYGDYVYNVESNKIIRKKNKCNNYNTEYVTYLYAYSYESNELSIYVNLAMLNDGMLYDFGNKKLGKYSGQVADLAKLTEDSSYYILRYDKDKNKYKLRSVEWKNKS